MRSRPRIGAWRVAVLLLAPPCLLPAACILDLGDLTGGKGGGGTGTCSCFGPPPAGWTGYFALYDGPDAQRPSCGGAFPTLMFRGNAAISAPPPKCSPCTCSPPEGQTCAASSTPLYTGDAPCGASISCETVLPAATGWDGSCDGSTSYAPGGRSGCGSGCAGGTVACNQQVTANKLLFGAGACTASKQTPISTPASWARVGEACAPLAMPGSLCAPATDTCVPIPSAAFHQGLCVMQVGDAPCPGGAFTQRHVFYGDVMDARGCTSCTCGAETGGSCSATLTVYSGAVCSGTPLATLQPTSEGVDCANLGGNPPVQARMEAIQITPGACPAGGGEPEGAATPIDPTTFCCIP
jgi:hypothetical protein